MAGFSLEEGIVLAVIFTHDPFLKNGRDKAHDLMSEKTSQNLIFAIGSGLSLGRGEHDSELF